MLKRSIILTALVLLLRAEPQIPAPAGNVITLGSGATRLVPNPSTAQPIMCNSIFIEPLAGGTHVVYVLNAPPDVAMALNGAGTTTVAQLAPATASLPGQGFTFPSNGTATSGAGGADLRYWGVAGTASETLLASCDLRN